MEKIKIKKNIELENISRRATASPATGFKKVHEEQQAEIVDKAFTPSP